MQVRGLCTDSLFLVLSFIYFFKKDVCLNSKIVFVRWTPQITMIVENSQRRFLNVINMEFIFIVVCVNAVS